MASGQVGNTDKKNLLELRLCVDGNKVELFSFLSKLLVQSFHEEGKERH